MSLSLRICGPKTSVCCSIISIWGIIMLKCTMHNTYLILASFWVLMGIFLYTHSLAFIEDLHLDKNITTPNDFLVDVNGLYTQAAYNCWVAACLYIITLAVSVQQYFMNRRANYSI